MDRECKEAVRRAASTRVIDARSLFARRERSMALAARARSARWVRRSLGRGARFPPRGFPASTPDAPGVAGPTSIAPIPSRTL